MFRGLVACADDALAIAVVLTRALDSPDAVHQEELQRLNDSSPKSEPGDGRPVHKLQCRKRSTTQGHAETSWEVAMRMMAERESTLRVVSLVERSRRTPGIGRR